ncbi:MAG: hypothetical protein QXV83_02715 [Candidatus Anstonellaceae archaeon]
MKEMSTFLEVTLKAQDLNKTSCASNFLNNKIAQKFHHFLPFIEPREAKEKLSHYSTVFNYLLLKVLKNNEEEPFLKWHEKFYNYYLKDITSDKKVNTYLILSQRLTQKNIKNDKNKFGFSEKSRILEYFFKEEEKDIIYYSINSWIELVTQNPHHRPKILIGAEEIKSKINQLNQENKTNMLISYSSQLVDYCIRSLNSCYLALKFFLSQY